ncbi:Nicotinamide phosphoribosyltransferase, partial [Geodia barretti]
MDDRDALAHNLLLTTDSYKLSHHFQYPPKTEVVYSYFESRGGKFPAVCFFGLQYIIKKWLEGVVVTKEKLEVAKSVCDAHLGPGIFNYDGWSYILEQHGGKLPLRIRAVPEGSVVPFRNGIYAKSARG